MNSTDVLIWVFAALPTKYIWSGNGPKIKESIDCSFFSVKTWPHLPTSRKMDSITNSLKMLMCTWVVGIEMFVMASSKASVASQCLMKGTMTGIMHGKFSMACRSYLRFIKRQRDPKLLEAMCRTVCRHPQNLCFGGLPSQQLALSTKF